MRTRASTGRDVASTSGLRRLSAPATPRAIRLARPRLSSTFLFVCPKRPDSTALVRVGRPMDLKTRFDQQAHIPDRGDSVAHGVGVGNVFDRAHATHAQTGIVP